MSSAQTWADGWMSGWTERERDREHPYLLFMHFLTAEQWGQMSKQDLTWGREESRKESSRDGTIGYVRKALMVNKLGNCWERSIPTGIKETPSNFRLHDVVNGFAVNWENLFVRKKWEQFGFCVTMWTLLVLSTFFQQSLSLLNLYSYNLGGSGVKLNPAGVLTPVPWPSLTNHKNIHTHTQPQAYGSDWCCWG